MTPSSFIRPYGHDHYALDRSCRRKCYNNNIDAPMACTSGMIEKEREMTYTSSSSSTLLFFFFSAQEEAIWHESIAWNIIYLSLPVFLTLYYIIPAPWGKLLPSKSKSSSSSSSTSRSSSSISSQRIIPKFTTDILLCGPQIPAQLAWILFESPNLIWAIVAWCHRRRPNDEQQDSSSLQLANYILYFLFVAHYIQRAIIYPFRMSSHSKPMPFIIVLSGFLYCSFNGYLQCRSLLYFHFFPDDWCRTIQFQFGLVLFVMGACINLQSDNILRNLSRQRQQRRQRQGQDVHDYQIPKGGLFEYCSTPHYFGEIIQWIGFCIASQYSLSSISFCIFTAANLIPRGVAQHTWYLEHFNDNNSKGKYPPNRKAIIPFLW